MLTSEHSGSGSNPEALIFLVKIYLNSICFTSVTKVLRARIRNNSSVGSITNLAITKLIIIK
jgi:hypothetical protein